MINQKPYNAGESNRSNVSPEPKPTHSADAMELMISSWTWMAIIGCPAISFPLALEMIRSTCTMFYKLQRLKSNRLSANYLCR
jgi:hypothetical protein